MNILAIGNSSGAKSVGQLLSQKNLFHAKKIDASINSNWQMATGSHSVTIMNSLYIIFHCLLVKSIVGW
jgi:hypothetical protein